MAAGKKGRTKDSKNERIWKSQCSRNGLRAPEWDAGLMPSPGCGLGRGLLVQSRGDSIPEDPEITADGQRRGLQEED